MLGEDSIGKVTDTLILDNCNRQGRENISLLQGLDGGVKGAEITEFLRCPQVSSTKERGKEAES